MKNPIILGYIDSYGAIHHSLCERFSPKSTHAAQFPCQTHKTFRFLLKEWRLENSLLSQDNLSQIEQDSILNFISKKYATTN